MAVDTPNSEHLHALGAESVDVTIGTKQTLQDYLEALEARVVALEEV